MFEPFLKKYSTLSHNYFNRPHILNGLFILAIVAVFIISIWLSVVQFQFTEELPSINAKSEFSVDRANEYREYISQEVRPIGSVAHERTKNYIISRLQGMGVIVEVQAIEKSMTDLGAPLDGKIENIVARIPGRTSAGTVLITTHYDSTLEEEILTATSSNVAALLETAGNLSTSGTLKNNVILLFSDGKEQGLLGAKAFLDSHRWAEDIDMVVNLEVRENLSQTVLLETNDRNEELIKGLMETAPIPANHSLIQDINKILPPNTEVSIFDEHGLNWVNLAFPTKEEGSDEIAGNRIQHHGENILYLVRLIGNMDIASQGEKLVYFNVLGQKLVKYEEKFVTKLMEVAIILFIGTVFHGIVKKQFTFTGIIVGMFVFLFTLPLAYFTGESVKRFVSLVAQWELKELNVSNIMILAIGLIVLSILVFIYSAVLKKFDGIDLTLGSFVGWLVLVILSSLFFKGSSYVFVWPFIIGLIGLNGLFLIQKNSNIQRQALSIAIVFVILVLTLPIVYLLFNLLTLEFAGVLALCLALIIAFMIPALSHIDKKYMAVLPTVFLLVGVVSMIINFAVRV